MTYKYETHCHTEESSGCGAISGAALADRYKELGFSGIIVTDHFLNGYSCAPHDAPWRRRIDIITAGYKAAKARGDEIGLSVCYGFEFTHLGKDVLTYGLTPDFLYKNKDIDKLSLPEYCVLARKHGAFLAQAHPYRDRDYIQKKGPLAPELLDAIETKNASDPPDSNKKALAFAQKHDLPIQAGSDAHSYHDAGKSGIEIDFLAKDVNDIISAIKNFKVKIL